MNRRRTVEALYKPPTSSEPPAPWPDVEDAAASPRPQAQRRAEVYAALDLGTNNCRLLVARPAGRGFRVIDAFSRIVRLGEGLAATGRLCEAAMTRTIEAIKVCAGKVEHRRVTQARYVATEACRRAANCDDFVARVRAETGIALETITCAEEARLVVEGCAPLLDRRIPWAVVFDIGGGSTELVFLRVPRDPMAAPRIEGFVSLPHGVVTLSDRYGGIDVARETYAAMVSEMRLAILPFEERHHIKCRIERGEVQMLGSSGTVTTLAGIQLELPRYNRALVDGSSLGFDCVSTLTQRLVDMTYAARAAHPCVGGERADLVLGGCAILEAICQLWPIGRLRVADRGIREGILMGLLGARAR
ncbi:MAG TPA: Ppx/GppA phosphatase family protein [Stellaceae bacterium]|nr:Ppx/GppA phosphatase family protein [Stellaceae bacterium]